MRLFKTARTNGFVVRVVRGLHKQKKRIKHLSSVHLKTYETRALEEAIGGSEAAGEDLQALEVPVSFFVGPAAAARNVLP
jgi:hypothetical protein